nr:hypothetical protein [Tanacetum cinerariifolium]
LLKKLNIDLHRSHSQVVFDHLIHQLIEPSVIRFHCFSIMRDLLSFLNRGVISIFLLLEFKDVLRLSLVGSLSSSDAVLDGGVIGLAISLPLCLEFGHFAKECRKPKRVKDSAYHKEKMLLCKKVEQRVPLQAEQYDWLVDTDEEVDEQELVAHYSYMAKIQEVPTADKGTDSKPVEHVQNDAEYNVFANDLQHFEQSESVNNTCLVETNDSNITLDSPDMCEDAIQNDQNDVESDDERVALTNLIANLKLDIDENKKIQKQLKKANTMLAQELKECKAILVETSKSLGESISVRDSCLVSLQTKQSEFEKYKAFNDRTIDYDKLERKLNKALGQLAQKDTVIKEGLKTKAYEL